MLLSVNDSTKQSETLILSNTLLSNKCTQRKNVELLKRIKIKEAPPTCFDLQGNHHQGATVSTELKLHTWFDAGI